MSTQIAIGIVWTLLTMGLAVAFIVLLRESIPRVLPAIENWPRPLRDATTLFGAVMWLLLGIFAIVAMWALLFIWLGDFSQIDVSLYFSVVSVTTVGYGDITLSPHSRLLAGFAAADGFLIFGLYTAALYEVIGRLQQPSG